MSDSQEKHRIISNIRALALELGRAPTILEFQRIHNVSLQLMRNYFRGDYQNLLRAADLDGYGKIKEPDSSEKILKKYTKLCAHVEKIQGFFRHTLDLSEMFNRAGNPKILKAIKMPDTHVKFMDKIAVSCFLKFCAFYQPDVFTILGDFPDCEGLSHWPTDSLEPRRIVPEMKQARSLLERIQACTMKATTRLYLTGNHENWIDQALGRMPEMFEGLDELGIEVSVKTLLGLDTFGYDIFPMNHLVQIGHAHFTHGIFTGNAHAKKHLETFKCNIYYGHLHDTQEYNATSIYGPIEAASLGCLARLDAKFLKGRPNNWVHSFGIFEFFPDGTYNFYKPKIFNGRMSYNGFIFDGNEST